MSRARFLCLALYLGTFMFAFKVPKTTSQWSLHEASSRGFPVVCRGSSDAYRSVKVAADID